MVMIVLYLFIFFQKVISILSKKNAFSKKSLLMVFAIVLMLYIVTATDQSDGCGPKTAVLARIGFLISQERMRLMRYKYYITRLLFDYLSTLPSLFVKSNRFIYFS